MILYNVEENNRIDSDIFKDGSTLSPSEVQIYYKRLETKISIYDTLKTSDAKQEIQDYKDKKPSNIFDSVKNSIKLYDNTGKVSDFTLPTIEGNIFGHAGSYKPTAVKFTFNKDGTTSQVVHLGAYAEKWKKVGTKVVSADISPNTNQLRHIIDTFNNREDT